MTQYVYTFGGGAETDDPRAKDKTITRNCHDDASALNRLVNSTSAAMWATVSAAEMSTNS